MPNVLLRQTAVTAACAVSVLLPSTAALAASSASSAASNAASTSVGSLSASLQHSSTSSNDNQGIAAGDYRVVEIADAQTRDGREGLVRLKLQAVAGSGAEGEFFLHLPPQALAQGAIATGTVVAARTRAYGIEFVQGEPPRAFFLLLADDWLRELRTQAVTI